MAVLLVSPLLFAQRPGRGMGPGQGRMRQQEPMNEEKLAEMRDTIRFLRLSESRKKLDFDDEKLVMINEVFDGLEEARFEMRGLEMNLRKTVTSKKASVEDRVTALNQLIEARQKLVEGEAQTWAELEEKLTKEELLEVFLFYEKFQKDVRRRLGQLGGGRNNGGRFDRRRNQ